MKINREYIPRTTIEHFADKHKLTMSVVERQRPINDPSRYYAHFDHCEVKDGCILCSESGNGKTPEEAIANYAASIEMKLLVVNAYKKNRREITIPRLIGSIM